MNRNALPQLFRSVDHNVRWLLQFISETVGIGIVRTVDFPTLPTNENYSRPFLKELYY